MTMKIHKLFWIWDYEKEENWLNDMAKKGYILQNVGIFTYYFRHSNDHKYQVRLDLLDDIASTTKSKQYIQFVESTGAQYIGSVARWAYFVKETSNGDFELYSDNASKIRFLNRIMGLMCIVFGMNIMFAINGFAHIEGIGLVGLFNASLAVLVACGMYKVYKNKKNIVKEGDMFE